MDQKLISLILYVFLGIIITFTVLILILLAPQFLDQEPTPFPTYSPTIPSSFMDRSFFTGQPCQPPCWYNLEVEKSTYDEVMSVVETLPFLNSDRITKANSGYYDANKKESVPSYFLKVECMSSRHQICVTLVFVDDILKGIKIYPNYPFIFDDTVKVLGPPDFVWASPSQRDMDTCDIFLLWPEQNIDIIARYVKNGNQELCSVVFNGIGVHSYIDVDSINYLASDHPAIRVTGTSPWNGFVDK